MEHNYSADIANIRDTFLSSEIDYLKQLSQVPEFKQLYEQYRAIGQSEFGASQLSTRLQTLTQAMDNGEVKEEEEGKVELEVMCCCLAIEDAVIRKTKILKPSLEEVKEEEMTNGRSR